jgi:antitoxin component YwqK of YwqJK toxin-antitoxin module
MKNLVIISFVFCITQFSLFAQGKEERTLFVVDSIPITKDLDEETGTIANEDIATLSVITTKSEIIKYGYNDIDKIIFIITKEYAARSEELKKIPTTNRMKRINGQWYLPNDKKPYSGIFIDYFPNGKKQGEGILQNGIVSGLRKVYHLNGKLSYEKMYENGIASGFCNEYYDNGQIEFKGQYKNGKEEGLCESWYQNGQKRSSTVYKNGEINGESTIWYSTGVLKSKIIFTNGKPQLSKEEQKIEKMQLRAKQYYDERNLKMAVNELTKVIELLPTSADSYFSRGTMKLNDFEFDAAIEDLDKAIKIEPMMAKAYTNRAFARLRKYQFKNSRTLSKSKEITVMASGDVVPIPDADKKLICEDLNKAKELGDKNELLIEALQQNCK